MLALVEGIPAILLPKYINSDYWIVFIQGNSANISFSHQMASKYYYSQAAGRHNDAAKLLNGVPT